MARRPTGSASVGRLLAAVACCLALATGCTGRATPGPGTGDSGSASVSTDRATSPASATSATSATSPTSAGGGGGGGSATDTGGGSGATDTGGGGGAGDGGSGAGAQAPGSPIDVPTVPEKHQSMTGLGDFIRSQFIEACGGSGLCVRLEFGKGACFVGYDPATRAARGSTVHVLTESQQECDLANGGGATTTTTDGTQGPASPTDTPSSGTTGSPAGGSSPDGGQTDGPTG